MNAWFTVRRLRASWLLASLLFSACTASVPGRDRPPVAVAGPDLRVPVGRAATLDGSGSFDPDGDAIADYAWQLLVVPAGSQAQLPAAGTAVVQLTPDRPGLYLVALYVTAGSLVSTPDLARVVAGVEGCRNDGDCPPCQACQPDGTCQEDLGRNQDCPLCHDCLAGQGCQPVAAGADPRGDCDDGQFCNGLETCDGQGACRAGTEPCPPPLGCDEAGDTCTGCSTHDDCPVCQKCSSDGGCENQASDEDLKDECPDGSCLTGFCDGQGACGILSAATPCDDGDACNGSDSCDDSGGCTQHSGSPCPETPCSTCQPDGSCVDPPGTPCSLAAACAGAGACNGAGTCQVTLDDDYCRAQDPQAICLPACAPADSGCLVPPGQATLSCNPQRLTPGESSTCTLTLAGGDTVSQEACLECRADSAPLLVAEADFNDNSGQCTLDGWVLVAGATSCNDTLSFIGSSCSSAAGAKDCCTELDKVCHTDSQGNVSLYHDKATDCGTKHEEWRLERTFDLTGLRRVRVCFAVKHEGTDNKDGLMLLAESGSDSQVLYCFAGGAEAGPAGVWQHVCSDPLDSWAEDNAAVTLRFVVHSEADNHKVFLDDVRVWAYGDNCQPGEISITESFLGATPDTCSRGDWTVVDPGGNLQCNSFDCVNRNDWSPGLEVDQASVNISKRFDLSAFDGFLAICLGLGWDGTDSNDFVTLRLDAGSGATTLLQMNGPFGTNQYCREFCAYVDRRLMPEVANNPDVLLELVLGSSTGKLALFWLEIRGEQFCPASGAALGDLVGDGLGNYDFSLSSPGVLQARLRCDWLGGPPSSGAWVVFR